MAVICNMKPFEDKVHILEPSEVSKLYNSYMYDYFDIDVKILQRKNKIMYEYVFDNYMDVLTQIAERLNLYFAFNEINIGMLLINNRVIQPYMFLKASSKRLIVSNFKTKESKMDPNLVKILDDLNSEGLELNARIDIKTPFNVCISSYGDWELINNEVI